MREGVPEIAIIRNKLCPVSFYRFITLKWQSFCVVLQSEKKQHLVVISTIKSCLKDHMLKSVIPHNEYVEGQFSKSCTLYYFSFVTNYLSFLLSNLSYNNAIYQQINKRKIHL